MKEKVRRKKENNSEKFKNTFTILTRNDVKYDRFDTMSFMEGLLPRLKNTFYNYGFQTVIFNEKDMSLYSLLTVKYGFQNNKHDATLPLIRAMYHKKLPITFKQLSYHVYGKNGGKRETVVIKGDLLSKEICEKVGGLYSLSQKTGKNVNEFPDTNEEKTESYFLSSVDFMYKGYVFRLHPCYSIETNASYQVIKSLILDTNFCGYVRDKKHAED